jgi:hypothetical protein
MLVGFIVLSCTNLFDIFSFNLEKNFRMVAKTPRMEKLRDDAKHSERRTVSPSETTFIRCNTLILFKIEEDATYYYSSTLRTTTVVDEKK